MCIFMQVSLVEREESRQCLTSEEPPFPSTCLQQTGMLMLDALNLGERQEGREGVGRIYAAGSSVPDGPTAHLRSTPAGLPGGRI